MATFLAMVSQLPPPTDRGRSSCKDQQSGTSMKKKFAIPGDQIRRIIPSMGYCYATDRITVDGCAIGYMYREEPDDDSDSGWRFFAGDESQEYVDDATNTMLYDVNTIANYDQTIVRFLAAPPPCAFERVDKNSGWTEIADNDDHHSDD